MDPAGGESAATTLRRSTGTREAIARFWRRPRLAGLALAVIYALCWLILAEVSRSYWFLPAGLRFATLWLTPPRRWGWFAAADFAVLLLVNSTQRDIHTDAGLVLATLLPWTVCALSIGLVRAGGVYAAPESPVRMASTLAAMLLASIVNGTVQASVQVIEGRGQFDQWLQVAFSYSIGDYVGMLMLVPIAFQLLQPRAPGNDWRRMVGELLLLFVPLLLLFAGLLYGRSVASLYAGALALFPMMLMAFRHGWRGASWALAATSLSLYVGLLNVDNVLSGEVLQLFLSLVGSVALLLGAAIGSLRRANVALTERNRQDQRANERLASQTEALRDLSRRLVRAREDEQRRLAHELHDELGQCVAALGTRLSLLARKTEDPEMLGAIATQRELVQRIQESIREVLQGLRPAMLDRFGLETALREGPIQRMLADAGVRYELRISGPVERVGGDTGSAIYRICQEAATNCVRHARAWNFQLQLDVVPTWVGDFEIHLEILDDGVGFDSARVLSASLGGGLRGIRDRVMALAGEHRCESGATGTRHAVWFVDRVPRAADTLP